MDLDFNLLLEDDQILLRPLEESDISKLMELASLPELWKYFTYDLSNPEDFQDWIQPAINKQRLQLLLIDKQENEIIGSSAFGNYSNRDLRIEIGWTWIVQSFHGLGYNQRMKKLMLSYCFEVLDVERVEFKTDVLNTPARKALKNINAIEEGVLRSHSLMTKGRRRDTIFYSILKNEWPFVKRENDW